MITKRWIKNFSEIAMPLNQLMRHNATWVWRKSGGSRWGVKVDLERWERRLFRFDSETAMEVEDRAASTTFPDPKLPGNSTVDAVEAHLVAMALEEFEDENPKYIQSAWYKDIYNFQRTNKLPRNLTQDEWKRFLNQARRYRIYDRELYVEIRGNWKRCITEEEVSQVLEAAHDNGGHYGSAMTMKRLKDYYWPKVSKDTVV